MSVDDLDEALKCLNDPIALSKTSLGLMELVAQRLQDQVSPHPTEKGKVIREILKEAFKMLEGSSYRSDSSSEWLYYNILYYRYFGPNPGLKHEHIATRLGFSSTRQYFRGREKALQSLHMALQHVECDPSEDL